MKKFLLASVIVMLVLALTAFPAFANSAATADVSVDKTGAGRGETVTVTVTLSGAPDLKSGGIEMIYDPNVLEPVSGTVHVNTMMASFDPSTGLAVFAFLGMNGFPASGNVNGTILTVTFRVLDTAALEQTQISCAMTGLQDATGAAVSCTTTTTATLTVTCPHANAYYKDAEPSTCQGQGNAAGIYCPDCDTYTSGGELLAPVPHTYVGEYDGWIYKGSQKHERECTVCHGVESEPHNYGNWTPNGETGEHEKVCSGCGDGESKPHTFDAEIATEAYLASAADCYNAATYYYSCPDCGLADTNTFTVGAPLTHEFDAQVVADEYLASAADCQNAASYYFSCSACGLADTNTFTVGSPLPHDYKEVVDDAFLVSAADCEHAAVYYKSCVCGETTSETFTFGTARGHDFSKTYTSNDTEHYYECLRDGCTVTDGRGAHAGGQATCSAQAVCDACGQSYGALADHVHDQEVAKPEYLKSEANCTQAALYYKSCACGHKGDETFSYGTELGHDFATTYSSNVNYHYYECLRDGCNATDGREQHAGGQATCSAKAICDACHSEYGSKAPHNYGEWSSVDENEQKHQCMDCLEWEYTAHKWDDGVVTKPATESSTGEKLLTCLDCGDTKTVETPSLSHVHVYINTWKHSDTEHWYECLCGERANVNGHDWEQEVVLAATCESKGTMKLTCTACAYTKTEEIPLSDHTWDAGTVTTAATEQTPGVLTHICTVCRETKTEEIPVLEHTHQTVSSAQWSVNDTHHWIACSCGDRIGEQAHAWVEEITPAACGVEGTKTYTCSVCAYVKTEVIPALEHTWNEGEVTVEATEEAAGVKTYTCTTCGSASRTEEIPQLEPTQTPDEPGEPVVPEEPERPCMWLFWLILLICIIIILLVIIFYMRKKDRYR